MRKLREEKSLLAIWVYHLEESSWTEIKFAFSTRHNFHWNESNMLLLDLKYKSNTS